jgi:hypothetical protein
MLGSSSLPHQLPSNKSRCILPEIQLTHWRRVVLPSTPERRVVTSTSGPSCTQQNCSCSGATVRQMANNWHIPWDLEDRIRIRDKVCVYCGKRFAANTKDRATWEHIDNNASNITELNVCLCCNSCNASKGAKDLEAWLKSEYCRIKSISAPSVAVVVRRFLLARSLPAACRD